MSHNNNTPILVGVAQHTWQDADINRTPVDALTQVAGAALADSGCAALANAVDTQVMVRFIADTNPGMAALFPRNPGLAIAERLGITGATLYQGVIGGNTPQYLVNHFARKLAQGEHGVVMLYGAELLNTAFSALRSGEDLSGWPGPPQSEPTTIGTERDGLNDAEKSHGLYEPINTYPLFENSLRHARGTDFESSQAHTAKLCSTMSEVAANNPYAWRTAWQSPEELASVDARNRYIGFPYTKAMNPVLAVDMAASVVMTTVGKAQELGIAPERWVYLHGGVDINDIWHVSERPLLHESPAIRTGWQALAAHTGISCDAITDFDLYSCFPSAVEVACQEIGLSPLDPRGVTVTGGLPYLGGPGNNYSLHGIAEMVERLRARQCGYGLVTANGLYLTKHSLGLYSTEAPASTWEAIDSEPLQQSIDAQPRLSLAHEAGGTATVESYTVAYGRSGPKTGIVIGRNSAGERVLATIEEDEQQLAQMVAHNPIGHEVNIIVEDARNRFEL